MYCLKTRLPINRGQQILRFAVLSAGCKDYMIGWLLTKIWRNLPASFMVRMCLLFVQSASATVVKQKKWLLCIHISIYIST